MITALTGKDVIKLNDTILNDFADGDTAMLNFPNDIIQLKTGKDGNSIYGFNNSGRQCELTLRVVRGGADDRFLNNLLALFKNDPPAFSLIVGEFVKNIGDGAGNITQDIYILSGGTFKKQVEVKENAEGDTEQAIAMYHLVFSNAPRAIG